MQIGSINQVNTVVKFMNKWKQKYLKKIQHCIAELCMPWKIGKKHWKKNKHKTKATKQIKQTKRHWPKYKLYVSSFMLCTSGVFIDSVNQEVELSR